MVHSPVPPFHLRKHDEISWLAHTIQTHLALACIPKCVDWRKFPEHSTTPCRGSPKSYRSRCLVLLVLPVWCNDHTGRRSPHNMFLGFWKKIHSSVCKLDRITEQSKASVHLKRALPLGFCCVQVNSTLKSLLSTFNHTQYAPEQVRRRYQLKFSRGSKA